MAEQEKHTSMQPHLDTTVSYGNILVMAGMIASGIFFYADLSSAVEHQDEAIRSNTTTLIEQGIRLRELEQERVKTHVLLDQIFSLTAKNEKKLDELIARLGPNRN